MLSKKRYKPERVKSIGMLILALGLFMIGAAVVLALPGAKIQALSNDDVSAIPVEVEYPAPELSLMDLQGNPTGLSTQRGQVVLVNNWATWCPPCKAEMPTLQAYYETYSDEGFIIIAIESGDPIEEVKDFVSQHGLTFPIWTDPEGRALEAFKNFDLPSSYVIDREGIVRLMWIGPVSRAVLEQYVTVLIRK